MAVKKIEGIKPFNDLQLKSCYNQQTAAVYMMFGINPKIIVGNFLPLYQFDAKQQLLLIHSCKILDENELESMTGIHVHKFVKTDELEEFVISHIDIGKPVLLLVDCFYLNYRKDTYLQKHCSHFILIYGYDREERGFIVNDHMYRNSYKYAERFVPIDVIVTAYKNFVAQLMENNYSLITFTKIGKGQGTVTETFKKGVTIRRNDLQKSILAFRKGIEYIHLCLSKEEMFEEEKDNIISFIGEVRGYKNIQKNIIGYICGEEVIYKISDRIVEDYIFIYGLMVKMKVMDQYNLQIINKILTRCNELFELESKLHSWLIRGDYA